MSHFDPLTNDQEISVFIDKRYDYLYYFCRQEYLCFNNVCSDTLLSFFVPPSHVVKMHKDRKRNSYNLFVTTEKFTKLFYIILTISILGVVRAKSNFNLYQQNILYVYSNVPLFV